MTTENLIPLGAGEGESEPFTLAPGEHKYLSYFGSDNGRIYIEKQASDDSWGNQVKDGVLSEGNGQIDLCFPGTFKLVRDETGGACGADAEVEA